MLKAIIISSETFLSQQFLSAFSPANPYQGVTEAAGQRLGLATLFLDKTTSNIFELAFDMSTTNL